LDLPGSAHSERGFRRREHRAVDRGQHVQEDGLYTDVSRIALPDLLAVLLVIGVALCWPERFAGGSECCGFPFVVPNQPVLTEHSPAFSN
jgi:hypothetical protein